MTSPRTRNLPRLKAMSLRSILNVDQAQQQIVAVDDARP